MYFTKFIGKHLCQSLFYNKVADPGLQLYQKRDSSTCVFLWILWNSQACYFIKKGILTQVFSCEFYEICKNTFLTEHLRATASGVISNNRFPFIAFLLAIISYRKDKVYFKISKRMLDSLALQYSWFQGWYLLPPVLFFFSC